MADNGTRSDVPEDVHTIADRLVRSCKAVGLSAEVLAATRVRARVPNTHAGLSEIITITPDEDEVLSLYWSWGERICSAAEMDTAVTAIKHVVTPPLHSAF